MSNDPRLSSDRFPRASRYHPDWVIAGMGSPSNALWLTEWLAEVLDLQPGMRVLDLGCGRAISSIFLRREFGVEVWATDLWFDPSENLQRIRDAGVEDGVFPIHADARSLPFAADFFDAIVSLDAYQYFGTDDLFVHSLGRFVKPGGQVGIAMSGLTHETGHNIPQHLDEWWNQDQLWSLHTADWWRWHLARAGVLDIESSDTLDDGWRYWLESLRTVAPDNQVEIAALEADAGRHIGYVRVVGRRRPDAPLHEPILSIPANYEARPMLR
ncbi:MAG: methyltransferase domain-containing protein [Planctomycetales bacterium]|nr:methyltransferase domain-containing protein [Planctomycetales bacterium]